MAATTHALLKGKNDALVLTASDWFVGLHRWSPGASYMPTDLTDSGGVLQTLGAGWMTSGEIQKAAGVSLAPDTQTADIEGYGSPSPRRKLVTGEGFTIDYMAQEQRKINQEIWHNTDMTTVSAEPGKGYTARKQSDLTVRYYSAILVAKDFASDYLYPWFKFPKVSVSKRAAMAGQIGKELGLGFTLTVLDDGEYGSLYDFGVAGPGFDDIAEAAGFAAAATSIDITPAIATIAVGIQLQMLVIDDNGFDRTAECTFGTSNAARATVSESGRVTAIATGSAATITATLGALTDTAAITVS